MTLLSIVQTVADRIPVAKPSFVINSGDDTTRQLLAIAQAEGKSLAKRTPWQALQKEATFATVATETQGTLATIASDLSRHYIRFCTLWNRTEEEPYDGPIDAKMWQAIKGENITGPNDWFRIWQDSLYITPAPTAGDTAALEYISVNWCQSSGSVGQSAWAADTDTGILDEDIMTLGILWRFKKDHGLDYAQDFVEYEQQVNDAISKDGGKPTVYMGGGSLRRGVLVGDSVTRSF